MAAKDERRSSDWYCVRCKRPLRNDGPRCQHKDTVTKQVKEPNVFFLHDGCGGTTLPGRTP